MKLSNESALALGQRRFILIMLTLSRLGILDIRRLRVHVGNIACIYLDTYVKSLRRSRNLRRHLLNRMRAVLAPDAEARECHSVMPSRFVPRAARITESHPRQTVQTKLALLRVILIFKGSLLARRV